MRHFLIRGGLLILLQLSLVNAIWRQGPTAFPDVYLGVLYALGGTMILGTLLLRSSPSFLLVVSLGLLIGVDASHPDPSQWGLIFDRPLGLLFGYSGGNQNLWVTFPILAWIELTVFGMLFGKRLLRDSRAGFQRGLMAGGLLLAAFIILRALDGFGNIRPRAGDTWIDFFNVVKYPPSLTFTGLTMGINLGLLWLFSTGGPRIQRALSPLIVFGKAPLFFYYVLHPALYLLLGRISAPQGTSIPAMIPRWQLGLAMMYPITRMYQAYKHSQPAGSLLRLL